MKRVWIGGLLLLEGLAVALIAFGHLLAGLVVLACSLAWLLVAGRKM